MPTYQDIQAAITVAKNRAVQAGALTAVEKSEARGVLCFDQASAAAAQNLPIGRGVCLGLVVEWLKCKKDGRPFPCLDAVQNQQMTVDTMLARARQVMLDGIAAQNAYVRGALPEHLLRQFGFAGVSEELNRWPRAPGYVAPAQAPWRQNLRNEAAVYAATEIEEAGYNFFDISIGGMSRTADNPVWRPWDHAICAYRPWTTFGKSRTYYLFDPNIGEFFVDEHTSHTVLRGIFGHYQHEGSQFLDLIIAGIR